MRILSFDPGENNFAWSSATFDLNNNVPLIVNVRTGMVRNTIKNLRAEARRMTKNPRDPERKPFAEEVKAFERELGGIFRQCLPEIVGTERYMVRGMRRGQSAETVSMMNGIVARTAISKRCQVRLYGAQEWKNWVNRRSNLESLYGVGQIRSMSHHTIDTLLMGLWLYRMHADLADDLFPDRVLRNLIRNALVLD